MCEQMLCMHVFFLMGGGLLCSVVMVVEGHGVVATFLWVVLVQWVCCVIVSWCFFLRTKKKFLS